MNTFFLAEHSSKTEAQKLGSLAGLYVMLEPMQGVFPAGFTANVKSTGK